MFLTNNNNTKQTTGGTDKMETIEYYQQVTGKHSGADNNKRSSAKTLDRGQYLDEYYNTRDSGDGEDIETKLNIVADKIINEIAEEKKEWSNFMKQEEKRNKAGVINSLKNLKNLNGLILGEMIDGAGE